MELPGSCGKKGNATNHMIQIQDELHGLIKTDIYFPMLSPRNQG